MSDDLSLTWHEEGPFPNSIIKAKLANTIPIKLYLVIDFATKLRIRYHPLNIGMEPFHHLTIKIKGALV